MKTILLFLCLIISACTGFPSPSPSPASTALKLNENIVSETITLTVVPATQKPVSIVTPSLQPRLNPTDTTSLAHRPTVTLPTSTATINAKAWLTAQVDNQRQTQRASFPKTCENTYATTDSISPSGNWLARSCGYNRDQTFEIVSLTGKRWVLRFKDYLTDAFLMDGNAPMGNLYAEKWINDEYLFFSARVAIDGGGICFYGFGAQGLYRIDLQNGTVSATLPSISEWDGYLFAFSPSGRRLVYSHNQPTILDLQTGEKTTIEVGDMVAGDFTWSPDGSRLVYATCKASESYIKAEKSDIQIYSLESHEARVIKQVKESYLAIDFSESNTLLKIAEINPITGNNDYSFFDWTADRFVTPTVTAAP